MPDPRNADDDGPPAAAPTEFEQPPLEDDRPAEETPTGGTGILTGIAQA